MDFWNSTNLKARGAAIHFESGRPQTHTFS
jgi:hypothetical protein